jgi:hypothetical protein
MSIKVEIIGVGIAGEEGGEERVLRMEVHYMYI